MKTTDQPGLMILCQYKLITPVSNRLIQNIETYDFTVIKGYM